MLGAVAARGNGMRARVLCVGLVWVALMGAAAAGQDEITNQRVVEMAKLGLDDEIIIARIKAGKAKFELADADLLSLKASGVSPKVVAAMLDASVLTEPKVTVNGTALDLHTLAQAKAGGRLGNLLTGGIKSVKWKAYLQGGSASASVASASTISIALELPRGDSPDNFLLVKLDAKDDRREIEVASGGGMVGLKSGIRTESIIETAIVPGGGNKFELVATALKRGSYLLFVVGSADAARGQYGRGYDFDVR